MELNFALNAKNVDVRKRITGTDILAVLVGARQFFILRG